MFILYFAVLSAMTPPVAVAAFAAAAIADAKPLEIATGAVRLAITAFIVPFAFMYGDGLLMVGNWQTILVSCVTAGIGVIMLSFGVEGYFKNNLSTVARWSFAGSGLLFIFPSWLAIVGALILAIVAYLVTPHLRSSFKIAG
jgi:TRAP-type uncharacterized transport system fused permease subunit